MSPRLNPEAIRKELAREDLPKEDRDWLENWLAEYNRLNEFNPLEGWWPHSKPQREFMEARTRVQAAFAGNRFGKSTALVVKALLHLIPDELVPKHLEQYRTTFKKQPPPCMGRIVVPDLTSTLHGVLLPAFRQWTPKDAYRAGSFDKSYDKVNRLLKFKGGSQVQFMTYEMDLDKFGGAALHFVAYDEPPPQDIRRECQMRTVDYAGFEMFAMTPLMGIGWVYRDIWKQREAPHITVVKGSMHDNPTLDQEAKAAVLAEYPPDHPERRAREFGDFAHFGGMIYPGGFERHLIDPPDPQQLRDLDVLVGMDPGLINAAFVWIGLDSDQIATAFDEVLLQNKTPADYAHAIRTVNKKWNVKPVYVIDPSARNRSLVNSENVQAELTRLGIPSIPGQNAVEAGIGQVRRRLQFDRLLISKDCRGLRSEAEEYRQQEREDGEFKVVKENDHRLDALRYALMQRPWHPDFDHKAKRRLGWVPGEDEPEWDPHGTRQDSGPIPV